MPTPKMTTKLAVYLLSNSVGAGNFAFTIPLPQKKKSLTGTESHIFQHTGCMPYFMVKKTP